MDGKLDMDAARAFIAFFTGPEWSTKLAWVGSNPGNRRGFRTSWMKQRLEQIKFLNVTTSMLPSGIPFPVIPESDEIMNIIVPNMMQNVLTRKMTVAAAADDAAGKVTNLLNSLEFRREGAVVLMMTMAPREPGLFGRIWRHRTDYLYIAPALA